MLRTLILSLALIIPAVSYAQTKDSLEQAQDALNEAASGGFHLEELVDRVVKDADAYSNSQTIRGSIENLKNMESSVFGDMPHQSAQRLHSSELLVFVSMSMPDDLLKEYMQEAGRYKGRLLVRGILDNDISLMMKRMSSLLSEFEEDSGVQGISIDPRGFDLHQVNVVPSIVLSEKSYELCEDDPCTDVGSVDKIVGAVSLKYALEQFAERGHNRKIAMARQ